VLLVLQRSIYIKIKIKIHIYTFRGRGRGMMDAYLAQEFPAATPTPTPTPVAWARQPTASHRIASQHQETLSPPLCEVVTIKHSRHHQTSRRAQLRALKSSRWTTTTATPIDCCPSRRTFQLNRMTELATCLQELPATTHLSPMPMATLLPLPQQRPRLLR
jgi:hypothetical protein